LFWELYGMAWASCGINCMYNSFFFCKYTGNFSTHEIQKDIFKSYWIQGLKCRGRLGGGGQGSPLQ
jgi:hypothetical protein